MAFGEGVGRMSVGEGGRAGDSRCCCMIKFFRGSIKGESGH